MKGRQREPRLKKTHQASGNRDTQEFCVRVSPAWTPVTVPMVAQQGGSAEAPWACSPAGREQGEGALPCLHAEQTHPYPTQTGQVSLSSALPGGAHGDRCHFSWGRIIVPIKAHLEMVVTVLLKSYLTQGTGGHLWVSESSSALCVCVCVCV